jgi:hypothetical protein
MEMEMQAVRKTMTRHNYNDDDGDNASACLMRVGRARVFDDECVTRQ